MKALPKKLLLLILFGIAFTSLVCVGPAQAYTVTLEQMGANVVATGSGAFDLTGLAFNTSFTATGLSIVPNNPTIFTGAVPATVSAYGDPNGFPFPGPASFGSGTGADASSGSGDFVGLGVVGGFVNVPLGYVSGNALSSSATWDNATFASLGVTPGTYVWSWGDGADQRFTLIIVGAGVPDGGTTVSLLGCALFGLAALRRKLGW